MNIFITGGTGFIGRHLVLAALARGHRLTLWVRNAQSARQLFGEQVEYLEARACDPNDGDLRLRSVIEACDAIVHLAGATVFKPWTPSYRREMIASRVDMAERIASGLAQVKPRSRAMVSASGVAIYGDTRGEWVDESGKESTGFLADLSRAWEGATLAMQGLHGSRAVVLRLGLVLGHEGGFLGKVLPMARRGLAATFGDGSAYVPWIHLQDVVGLFLFSVENQHVSGILNAVAPNPVSQRVLLDELAKRVGQKVRLRVPMLAFRALGEQGAMFIDSQRLVPRRALDRGYAFKFASIDEALDDILVDAPLEFTGDGNVSQQVSVAVKRPDLFQFFADPQNLALLTPGFVNIVNEEVPDKMEAGVQIGHRLSVLGLNLRWRSEITSWQPPHGFVDQALNGPFRSWTHEHSFDEDAEGGCVINDRIRYKLGIGPLPLGPFNGLVNRWIVRPRLQRVFAFRSQGIKIWSSHKASADSVRSSLVHTI